MHESVRVCRSTQCFTPLPSLLPWFELVYGNIFDYGILQLTRGNTTPVIIMRVSNASAMFIIYYLLNNRNLIISV